MPNTTQSQFMLIQIPIPTVEIGPQWASDINSALTVIDQHNHSAGQGVPINPTGININSDLSFGSNNATNLRSTRYTSQSSTLSGGLDLNCAYVLNGNLYYNDSLGNKIQLTASGSIAGSPGSITGLVPPASVTFVSATGKYVFQSATNVPATLDIGPIILRNASSGSNGVTLTPTSNTTNWTLTATSAPPSILSTLTMNSAGQLGFSTIGSTPAPVTTSVGYALATTDETVLFTGSSTARLPSAIGLAGKTYTIEAISSGISVPILTTNNETIGNRPSSGIILNRQWDNLTIISDNANWQIVSKKETQYFATSSTNQGLTAIGSGNFGLMTGANFTLPIGQWRLSGYINLWTGTGVSATVVYGGFYSGNGANNSVEPTALLGQVDGFRNFIPNPVPAGTLGNIAAGIFNTSTINCTLTTSTTASVYLIPQVGFGSAGNAAVTCNLWAERIW